MSLIKMLSVSKSFMGGRNPPGRYRMVEQAALPKFAPVGRPISLAPKRKSEEPGGRESREKSQSTASSLGNAAPGLALDPLPGGTSPFAGSIALAAAAPAAPVAICANTVPSSTNWFRLGKNTFMHRPREPIRPPAPVQTELSLDAVKPVRNDLSDADLEVVPAKHETKHETNRSGAQTPPRRRSFKAELTGFAWSRLTARLFHSERART